MVDFKKILAGAKKNWAGAKKRVAERESGFPEYDDGLYLARLVGAELGQSGSGRNQIDFSWKFIEGEYENKVKHDYQGLDTEDNLYYLGQRIEDLGYEVPDDLGDLPELLKAIIKEKPVCKISLKTKGDFQNVYIRKLITDDDAEDEAETEDEDIEETEETDDDEGSDEEESDDAEESDEEEEDADEESDEEESDDDAEEESEEEDDDADEEEVELEIGMKVIAETAKGRLPGTITKMLEKENAVQVKLEDGRLVRLPVEKIELPAEDEDVPEEPKSKKKTAKPEPKKVTGKKSPPPAPAKKSKVVDKGKKKARR